MTGAAERTLIAAGERKSLAAANFRLTGLTPYARFGNVPVLVGR